MKNSAGNHERLLATMSDNNGKKIFQNINYRNYKDYAQTTLCCTI